MKKFGIIIFLSLYFIGSAMAQSDFRPGFIITNAGDTIYGEIDYRGDQLMGSICRFSSNGTSTVEEYFPRDLYGFRFIDSKYFISREVDIDSVRIKVFLEYLINGKLSIFYYRNEKGDYYFVEKEGGEIVLLPYQEEVHKIGGKPYLSKSKRHIGILKSLTNDAPVFSSRLDQLKKPDHKDLVNLAEDYHYAVCKDQECIVYEKKIPLLKVSAEAVYGIIKYKGMDQFVSEIGAHLFLWLPRSNEKLHLKTGYLYNDFLIERNFYRISKFPLQIQYLYPNKAFRPKMNIGVNFYAVQRNNYFTNSFHTFHLGTGFNYKLYKSFFLSTNLSTELTPLSTSTLGGDRPAYSKVGYSFNVGAYIIF